MSWEDCGGDTRRLRVPGGWLYTKGVDTLAFVPEPSKVTAPDGGAHLAPLLRRAAKHLDNCSDGTEAVEVCVYALTETAKELEGEPSKVTAQQNDDLDWERGHQAGYMQALAVEKVAIGEIIVSLESVIDLIDLDEKTYAVSHITGIINALRSGKT